MRKIMMLLSAVLLMAVCSGCAGDSSVEKKLEGNWVSVETEDGMTVKEKLELNATTHEFTNEVKYTYSGQKLADYKITGKWSATEDEITFDFSEDDIKLNVSLEFLKSCGYTLPELKKDIMEENGAFRMNINSSDDEFTIIDDSGEKTVYSRKEK